MKTVIKTPDVVSEVPFGSKVRKGTYTSVSITPGEKEAWIKAEGAKRGQTEETAAVRANKYLDNLASRTMVGVDRPIVQPVGHHDVVDYNS